MGLGKGIQRRDGGQQGQHERTLGWTGGVAPGIGPISSAFDDFGINNLLDTFPGEGAYAVSGQTGLWYYRRALSIPAMWRGARLLSFLFGGLDFDAYTTHGKAQETLINPRPALLEQPNPQEPRVNTFSSSCLDYLFDGNAIWLKAQVDSMGKATTVTPVPAWQCFVRRVGQYGSELTSTPIGELEYQIAGKYYTPDQVIHFKGLAAPGAVRGFGILEAHLLGTLFKAHEEQRWARNLARPGVPPGYLRVTNDSEEANDPTAMATIKNSWMEQRDAGGVAMLNNAVDFTPIAWTPDNMQMIQAREMTAAEIANLLGVPFKFVGAKGGDPMTYSTAETEGQDLINYSLNEILIPFEQRLSLEFPRGTNVRADLDKLLRGDRLQRYQAYLLGREAGWLSIEKIAEWEGIDPKDLPKDDAPSAAVQKYLNKIIPIDQTGVKQVTVSDLSGPPIPGGAPKAAIPAAPPAPSFPSAGQGKPGPGPLAPGVPPVKALAKRMDMSTADHLRAVSRLEFKPGTALWEYWTHGKGFLKWSTAPQPWTALHTLLLSEGVPAVQADGLATNIMQATPVGKALYAAHHQGGN